LADYRVEIIPTSRRRGPGQTHAGGVLRRILRERGAEHLRLVLGLIRGSSRNREALNGETIASVSDVLIQRPDWLERFADLVDVFERVNLEGLRDRAVQLRPWPVRDTLRAFLYAVLRDRLGAADEVQDQHPMAAAA
jgi:hypothetical protein